MKISVRTKFLFGFFTLTLAFGTLLAGLQQAKATDHWELVGSQNFDTGNYWQSSIAFNPSTKQPYIALVDYSDNIIVKGFNGTDWVSIGTNPVAVNSEDPDLKFNPSTKQPYLLCRNMASGFPEVKVFDGSSWSRLGAADGISAVPGLRGSLAFDPTTYEPYVAFYASVTTHSYANVKKYTGSVWESVGTANFAETATTLRIAFNPADGLPYVIYDDKNDSRKLKVQKFFGGDWTNVSTPGVYTSAYYAGIDFSPTGDLYVGFRDTANSNKVTVWKYSSDTWSTVGTAGFASAVGTASVHNVDVYYNKYTNQPFLTYLTSTGASEVLYFDGDTWQSLGTNEWDTSTSYIFSSAMKPSTGEIFYTFGADKPSVVRYKLDNPPAEEDPGDTPPGDSDTSAPIFANLPGLADIINITDSQTITTNPFIIRVHPTDAVGVTKVEFYVDDNMICSATTADSDGVYSCLWDTSKYHSIVKVYAYDSAGNRSTVLQRTAVVDPRLYLTELPATGK